jgi:hypothetical protein
MQLSLQILTSLGANKYMWKNADHVQLHMAAISITEGICAVLEEAPRDARLPRVVVAFRKKATVVDLCLVEGVET